MKPLMLKKRIASAVLIALVSCGLVGIVAQTNTPPVTNTNQAPAKAEPKPIIPLRLQVTLAKFEGEKKTENLPFTLVVNANGDPTNLQVGTRVPTGMNDNTSNVGTNFSVRASMPASNVGQFYINLSIQDSSLVPAKSNPIAPAIKSVSISNGVLLRDGQTSEFVAATDKLTGEVTKVSVTLTVIK